MNYPQFLLSSILDTIFPKRCVGCGNIEESYLCKKCLNSIKIKGSFECIGCEAKTSLGKTCILCIKSTNMDNLLPATDYRDKKVIAIIKCFKYRFIKEASGPIFELLKRYMRNLSRKNFNILDDNPLLIPVPLHSKRLNWRGFNQSQILAKMISDKFQTDFTDNILVKIKESTPQADLEKEERLVNPNGTFTLINADKIKNRSIILVDDVCTTGSTLNECAKILKENGASKVMALVVAKG